MSTGLPVSWGETIAALCRAQIAGLRTSIPGKVLRYDDSVQRADVEILVNDYFFSEDTPGVPIYEEIPALLNVPVRWLRAGGFVLTMPLGTGDRVWVDFAERSLSEWKANGNKADPRDLQRHAEWATCTPGGHPETEPLASGDSGARAAGVLLGKDGAEEQLRIASGSIKLGATASDLVALSSKVDAWMTEIKTLFNRHVHTASSFGTATTTPQNGLAYPTPDPIAGSGSTAAAITKAK